MSDAEKVVGYLFAWMRRRAGRVKGRGNEQADAWMAGADKAAEALHAVLARDASTEQALSL